MNDKSGEVKCNIANYWLEHDDWFMDTFWSMSPGLTDIKDDLRNSQMYLDMRYSYQEACRKRQKEIDQKDERIKKLEAKVKAPRKCLSCGERSMWSEDIDYEDKISQLEQRLEKARVMIEELRHHLRDCDDNCGWARHSKSCREASKVDEKARAYLSEGEK